MSQFFFFFPSEGEFERQIRLGAERFKLDDTIASSFEALKKGEGSSKYCATERKFKESLFREIYRSKLNLAIFERYSDRRYSVNYVLFADEAESPMLSMNNGQNVISLPEARSYYFKNTGPDGTLVRHVEELLRRKQLAKEVVIAGFHLREVYPAVERVAREGATRMISTDMDLTEDFVEVIGSASFMLDKTNNYHLIKINHDKARIAAMRKLSRSVEQAID